MLKLPKKVPKLGFYYHYKHDPKGSINNYVYEVLSVGFHTEDDARPGEEHYLNYRPLYKEASVYKASLELGIQCVDNRPLKMWMGNVSKVGKRFPRFQRITDFMVIGELKIIRDEMYPNKSPEDQVWIHSLCRCGGNLKLYENTPDSDKKYSCVICKAIYELVRLTPVSPVATLVKGISC